MLSAQADTRQLAKALLQNGSSADCYERIVCEGGNKNRRNRHQTSSGHFDCCGEFKNALGPEFIVYIVCRRLPRPVGKR